MAKLIPDFIAPNTPSPGEIDLFNRLRNESGTEGWWVLHSLNVVEHAKKVESEIDFVVIVPEMGVLCIEVKAHQTISRQNGTWIYGKGAYAKRDYIGPFEQVKSAKYALRKFVLEQDEVLGNAIPFFSTVLFTHTDFDEASPEWHMWQLVNMQKYNNESISEIVIGILQQARKHMAGKPNVKWFRVTDKRPSVAECKQLVQILRGNFEYVEPVNVRLERYESEIKRFTEEQYKALDWMGDNKRVLFTGPAGTGKTFLAVEAARRAEANGKRVLVVCFNKLLGMWLAAEMEARKLTTKVGTLHQLMLDVTGGKVPQNADSRYWGEELPLQMTEYLLEADVADQYDLLIIDEAQDIIHNPNYCDVLDLLLQNGLQSGHWFVFGDFEKQSIYVEDRHAVYKALEERFGYYAKGSLGINCRNTPEIAQYAQWLTDMEKPYRSVLRKVGDVKPMLKWYSSPVQQKRVFSGVLDNLLNKGISLRDIVVLSTRANEKSLVASLDKGLQEMFLPLAQVGYKRWHQERVKGVYASIHAFKGMEARHLIITDVDEVGTEMMNALLYVGITRALHNLIIIASDNARDKFATMLTRLEDT